MINYGWIEPVIDETHYILGGLGSLPKIILQPNANWYTYLPLYEPQFGDGWDTYGCTVWGTENAVETLMCKLSDGDYNYSERYIYNIVGINPPGSDPHLVAETIRKTGLIDEALLPFTKTEQEFITPRPMAQNFLNQGKKWLNQYDFKHEWLWSGEIDSSKKLSLIKECLLYSPICVSVTAWIKDGEEYISDGQPNTHWCLAFRVDEQDRIWIFDSYTQDVKILAKDHYIKFAKRYYLQPKDINVQYNNILQKLVLILQSYANLLKKSLGSVFPSKSN